MVSWSPVFNDFQALQAKASSAGQVDAVKGFAIAES